MRRERVLKIRWCIPILIMIVVVPIIVIYKRYMSEVADCAWISDRDHFFDFFLYYKNALLKLLGIAISILFIVISKKELKGKITKDVLIPAGIFLFFSFVSALFADHQTVAFFGGFDTFEGFFVLLSYIVAFVYVYCFSANERWLYFLLHSLIVGSLLVGLIGTLQVLGIEYFTSEWYRPLMTIFYSGEINPTLTFEAGTSFTTLYNPDYVGSYVALVLPVLLVEVFLDKKILFKILAALAAIMQVIILIGAGAAGGFIGLAAAFLICLVFLCSQFLRYKYIVFLMIVIGVLGAIGMVKTHPTIFVGDADTKTRIISNIEGKEGEFKIYTDSGKTIVATLSNIRDICSFTLCDKDGKALETEGTLDGVISLKGEGYESIYISTAKEKDSDGDDHTVLKISDGNHTWNLLVLDDNEVGILNFWGKLDHIHYVRTFGFDPGSWFLNGRGHIWSRTFPLLTDTILCGVGSDNFVYAYPNDDYVGRVNNDEQNRFYTKPHNMFMQIWIQDGMLSCLALIFLYINLFYRVVKFAFVNRRKNKIQITSIAILCGVTGYLTVGLVNDMNLCVAPVFWVLFGLGFAVTRIKVKDGISYI